MSAPTPVFLVLQGDRLCIRVEAVVAVTELGESEIDARTGRLALGIPEGSLAVVHTDSQTFYVKTDYDAIVKAILALTVEGVDRG